VKIKKTKIGVISYIEPETPIADEVVSQLRKAVDDCFKESEYKLVINFRSVPYIDSEGLETLLDILAEVRKKGGSIKLADPNTVCSDIFTAARFDSLFEIYTSADKAGRSFL